MLNFKPIVLFSILCAASSLAQTLEVQLVTDALIPQVLSSNYPMGQTSTHHFVYGPSFLVKVSFQNAENHTFNLMLSGSQPDYELVWQADGDLIPRTFAVQMGPGVAGLSGSGTDLYYRNDGTLQPFPGQATRYQIGVRTTRDASVDLQTEVVLTVTLD